MNLNATTPSQTITLDGPDWRIATDPENIRARGEMVRGAPSGGKAGNGALHDSGDISQLWDIVVVAI